ncbi:FecR family protein [Flagellimonas algicola]|uniref:DUF4974 domain-containing protein n=1 Tax=Flagellimonas algicola TaxID=2583815 RepID=A0ABY2WGN2_9FLAO|nr:FecR domain-containing protein [Allomuricauda algicola]TMU50433.1 DUF4974 domain-containing protein [Allomuricauda algicola]
MHKNDFLELVDKFNRGECSDTEKSLLFEFCERAQVKDLMSVWDLSEEEKSKIRLLRRIITTVDGYQHAQERKVKWRNFASYAAIFIGLISVGFLYLYVTSNKSMVIPDDAITLELEDGTIKVIEENGIVKVLDKKGNTIGQQQGDQLVYNDVDSQELAYNTLTVPFGKRFELRLSDGTMAHLNAGSSVRFPIQFLEGMDRQVFVSGEAYLDVAKDSLHPFIVNADKLNVRVLGTRFNVHAYQEDGISEIVLVEGSVGLYEKDELFDKDRATMLTPGYKASFRKNNGEIEVKPAITSIYTAWRKGELVFRNMTFENILKKLERHYDVTITNENKNLTGKEFNASFKAVPLEKVLKSMSEVYDLRYSIENDKITIQ